MSCYYKYWLEVYVTRAGPSGQGGNEHISFNAQLTFCKVYGLLPSLTESVDTTVGRELICRPTPTPKTQSCRKTKITTHYFSVYTLFSLG